MSQKLVYVDTDVGLGTPGAEIDDGAALIFLLRHPHVRVIGAGSVFGNVPLRDADLNLDRLLTWLDGGEIPRGMGAAAPLIEDTHWFRGWQSGYGETLPWDARPSACLAANLIVDLVHAYPGQVSILSLGPLTNVALALRLDPSIASLTREVIAMGGSFSTEDAAPEFNARCDPESAQIVFSAGWDLHILGLDVTRRVHFSRDAFDSLSERHPAVGLLRAQAPGWIDWVEGMGWAHDGCALHDAVAAAYLVDDSSFKTERTAVGVELANRKRRGLTRFTPAADAARAVNVVTGLDPAACRDLIWSGVAQ